MEKTIKMEKTISAGFANYKITDIFGDSIHCSERNLLELYDLIAKNVVYNDYRGDDDGR